MMGETGHSLRQIHLRYKLEAVEFYLNTSNFPEIKEWLEKRRHDIIEELNRVQLEEWNYD